MGITFGAQGMIVANGSAELFVNITSLTNTGTLRADGGMLTLGNGTITNTGATIEALNSSAVSLKNTVIVGGNLSASNNSLISVPTGWSASLNGVTLTTGSLLNAENAASTTLVDTFTNNGTIALNSSGNWTRLYMSGSNVTLGGTGTVNMSNNIYNSIDGSLNNFTIGSGQTFQGAGQFNNFNSIVNQGIIVASGSAGLTFNMNAGTSLTNTGIFQVNAGSTMNVNNGLNNYSSNTLTGGTYKVYGTAGNAGNMRLANANIVTNAATILLDGPNSNLLRDDTGMNALANFATNAAAGNFTMQNGRNFNTAGAFSNAGVVQVGNIPGDTSTFTTNGAFNNTGVLQMQGGTFSAGASGSLTNTISGEVNGYGMITTPVLNHGLVRASGGNLNATIDGQSGTVQINSGASLTLSGNSDASYLIHNGNTAGSLALGTYNFTVDKDYNNANFSTGNSFDRRANVSGGGQIIGNNAAQAITGNVTNGATPTVTMDLGNVRGGTTKTLNYQIANTGTGADIRGAVQTGAPGLGNITDGRLSGTGVTAGNFGPIVAAGNSGNLPVIFTASSGGLLTGQSVAVVSNFDNVTSQVININGLASALAQGNATPNANPVVLGNFHVTGTQPSQAFAVENTTTSSSYTERLGIASVGTTGNFSAANNLGSGFISGGTSQANAVSAQVNNGLAGLNSGSMTIQYTTNGVPIDASFTNINANSQTINLQATGYNLAVGNVTPAPVVLANQRVGGSTGWILTVTNTAPSGVYTEGLNAAFGANTGDASNNGQTLTRLPGNSSNGNTMAVGLNTSTAGAKTGTVTLNYVSDGTGTSGLGLTGVGSQIINVSGNVYQVAAGNASSPVQVANQRIGGSNTTAVIVANNATGSGFGEDLNVSIGGTSGATGSGSIAGRLAGTNNTGTGAITVGVNTATAGANTGTVTLNYQTAGTVNGVSNGLGVAGAGNQVVTVNGNVYQAATGAIQTAALNFGTVQVGQLVSQSLVIRNTATGASGFVEDLNASFGSTSGTGASLISGTGSLNGILAGTNSTASNGTMTVSVNTSAAGTINGAIAINYQTAGAVNGVSNGLGPASVGSDSYGVSGVIQTGGQIVNQASPVINTSQPINLGNVRVNATSPTAFVSVTNQSTTAPQAALNASISGNAPITASGSFNLLDPGQSNSNSLQVGMNTGTAGAINGSATIAFVSDASNIGGCGPNCQMNLASQNVQVTGGVYQAAQPSVPTSVNLGNVRIGNNPSQAIAIGNTNLSPAGYQEGLNVTVGTLSGGATGGGSILNLAAGNSSNAINVGLNVGAAGLQAGAVTLNLASNGAISGLTDLSLGTANVQVQATGYRLANPTLNTTSVTIAARVGDPVSANQAVSITNTSSDIYTEGLKVSVAGISGNSQSNGGSIANLAAQGTNNTSILVGLGSTATAGTTSGSVALNLVSTGAGTTGASDYTLAPQSVTVTGKVYTPAVALLNTPAIGFGIVHVGESVADRTVSISNNASTTALNDVLRGSLSSTAGPFTGNGNLGAGLAAQQTDNTSFKVSLNTSNAGNYSQAMQVITTSYNPDLGDLNLPALSLSLEAQINNYASPIYQFVSGTGGLTGSGTTYTLDLGDLLLNSGTSSAYLQIKNDVLGPADLLDGSFGFDLSPFVLTTGFNSFFDITAGGIFSGLQVALNTATLGSFTDTIILYSLGHNASGYSGALGDITLNITGQVIDQGSTVPEPGTWFLLGAGLLGLGFLRRRFIR